MEFRKMVMTILYTRQQKRHRCKEQTFGLWEKMRVGYFERTALKHVYYHMWNRSPVQVRCMRQGPQGQCTEMTLRDGMGREVGGRVRMGSTCTPMADSCQCMAKPLQYCKVISLQLKWINLYFKKERKKSHPLVWLPRWPSGKESACQCRKRWRHGFSS